MKLLTNHLRLADFPDVPIPNGMQALIVSITSPFPEGADDGNAEKLGQGIAKMWLEYREMAELKGQEVLKDWLGYRGYDEKSSETFQ